MSTPAKHHTSTPKSNTTTTLLSQHCMPTSANIPHLQLLQHCLLSVFQPLQLSGVPPLLHVHPEAHHPVKQQGTGRHSHGPACSLKVLLVAVCALGLLLHLQGVCKTNVIANMHQCVQMQWLASPGSRTWPSPPYDTAVASVQSQAVPENLLPDQLTTSLTDVNRCCSADVPLDGVC